MAKSSRGTWITVNGRHILIRRGESKSAAIKRASGGKIKAKKIKGVKSNKAARDKINKKYDKKQDDLYEKLGKKNTIAARQDYDRGYNRIERSRKKALSKLSKKYTRKKKSK